MKCKISAWGCVYHACMSNDCQRHHVIKSGSAFGNGACGFTPPQKCFVILLSKRFPSNHSKAGKKTVFAEKIRQKVKIHTLRNDYNLWKKQVDMVKSGHAYISVREWIGRPYHTKQVELFRYDMNDELGVERVVLNEYAQIGSETVPKFILAKNDGLEYDDFKEWTKNCPKKPMAIIHFTDFRYSEMNIQFPAGHQIFDDFSNSYFYITKIN